MKLTSVGDSVKPYKTSFSAKDYTPWLFKNRLTGKRLQELPPCIYGEPVIDYFNDPVVRAALHIDIATPWDMCSDIDYTEGTLGS